MLTPMGDAKEETKTLAPSVGGVAEGGGHPLFHQGTMQPAAASAAAAAAATTEIVHYRVCKSFATCLCNRWKKANPTKMGEQN